MSQGLKNALAILAGLISGVVTIFMFEFINSMNIKMPEGLDTTNREAMAAWMATLPLSAYIMLLVGYAAAALDGSIIATLISGRTAQRPAMMVGLVLTLFNILNLVMLPQPVWFAVASCIIYLPFAFLGYALTRKRS